MKKDKLPKNIIDESGYMNDAMKKKAKEVLAKKKKKG